MSLGEFPDTVCGHLLRTVRADGFIPLCQGSGIGEQHLFADGCDYADWLARQDGHPDYGVCHRAAPQGNGHCGISLFGRPGPFASYPDDFIYLPVFYIIFEYLQEKVRPPMEEEADMQVLLEKQKSEAERAKD